MITPQEKMDNRKAVSEKYLFGDGVEIGALHAPLWVSQKAKVKYVDILTETQNAARYKELNPGEIVKTDIVDDGETLSTVADESLDFIIGNHFLEHCMNPLGTVRRHLKKLKKGGTLYYAIPNKDLTFDSKRAITPFDHLVRDDTEGTEWSKLDHYRDFARHVDKLTSDTAVDNHARKLIEMDNRIHFHVWDSHAVRDMIEKARVYLNGAFSAELIMDNENEVLVILKKT